MKEKDFVFEDGLRRLEEIVRLLERGDAPLDQSLTLFEEGMGLIKNCGTALGDAEQKIKLLAAGAQPKLTDFEVSES